MADARPYLFDFDPLLSEDERLTWKAARDFCEKTVRPKVAESYEAGTFPRDLVPAFAKMGFLGGPLEGYGCPGQDPVSYGLTMLELERQDSGFRSFCSVQTALAMWPIHAYGSEEQKARYLPDMAAGRRIGCFGLTEPNAGSDPGSMRTHARQDGPGGDFILNGQKMWITNSPIADLCIVWARTQMHGETAPEIRGFIVDRDTKGLSTPEIHGKLSLRASITGEIVLDDARVPKENLLPGVRGLKGPLSCLTQARYGIGWGVVGAAMACYERARSYALERTQFGKPLAAFQLTQQKLVDMHDAVVQGFLLALTFGREKAAGRLGPLHVSMLKRNNVHMARKVAAEARTILGGNGIMLEFDVMRHMCNLETVYTYEGTHEVHTLAIGRKITGISAFS